MFWDTQLFLLFMSVCFCFYDFVGKVLDVQQIRKSFLQVQSYRISWPIVKSIVDPPFFFLKNDKRD